MKTLHDVDLNLWLVLKWLLQTSSVTETATRLGRTQSSVSHSLATLRQVFGDPLFVRVGARLQATPRALSLSGPVNEAVAAVERSLAPSPRFEPGALARTFRLFASDYVQVVVLPRLLELLRQEAPKVLVDVTFRADATAEVFAEVQAGRLEVMVGPTLVGPAGVVTQKLFRDENVCVVREGHPFANAPRLKTWLSLPHVLVTPRGGFRDFVDDLLEHQGLSRIVVARMPHYSAAMAVVARGDMVAQVPKRLAEALARGHGLAVVASPLPLPGFAMAVYFPETLRADAGHVWFRGLLRRAANAA